MITPLLRILPPAQAKLWPLLSPSKKFGFVLYGGTAVALRFGHRVSVDFDFFSDRPLDKDALRAEFPFLNSGEVLQDVPHTLTVLTFPTNEKKQGVKVTFLGNIRFGRHSDPDRTSDGVLNIASPEDLLATKLSALMNRVESKDYRDVSTLLEAGVPLENGLAIAWQMHPHSFQPQECLRVLTYFEGGDLSRLPRSDRVRLIEAARLIRDLPPLPPLRLGLAPS